MKTAYQQFNSSLMPAIRQVQRYGHCANREGLRSAPVGADLPTAFNVVMDDLCDQDIVWGNNALMQFQVELKDCVHLFIKDESFLDWLVSCAPTLEDGSPEAVLEMTGGEVCVLHFPTASKYRCLAFQYFGYTAKSDNVPSMLITFSRIGASAPFSCVCFDMALWPVAVDFGPLTITHVRLLNALGLYLACFPEMLRAGPPDDVKHPSHHQYAVSKTVGISPKVLEHTERGEVSAHFRKGHFRTLRSERFTHKRWKAVFVKATFVKGEALTILSPEEA